MTRIILTKEDCFCNIAEFYKNVAWKSGIDVAEDSEPTFNCTKICVTKPVMEEIFRYYEEVISLEVFIIGQQWFKYGPKASLDGDGYVAEYDDGFIAIDIPLF